MRERYKVCTSCGTIHQIHHTFKDKRPTCYKCGRTSFEDTNVSQKALPSYVPIMCDWNLQRSVDESADSLLEIIIDKHNSATEGDTQFNIDSSLKESLKQYFVFAANTNRKGFVSSINSFTNYYLGKDG